MSDDDFPLDAGLRDRMAANLDGFDRRQAALAGHRHAAIAITVIDDGGGRAAFVLTRRTAHLNNHAGQLALPGGRVEHGETAAEAALRELDEEVGLTLPPDRVLGLLDDYVTRSGYVITPVVVWGGGAVELTPDPGEVAEIFRITLQELHRPGSPEFVRIPESERPVVRLLIGDDKLHAPSAAMVYQFREVALHGRTIRVDHLEQPVWAWR